MLAVAIPQLAAIIGGHEHDMQFEKVGNVYISKAHSNAKTAFHLRLLIERNNNICTTVVIPDLVPLDTSIEQDYLTKAICERWMDGAVDYFKRSGFSPGKPVCKNFNGMLDGRDSKIRNGQTNLTRLITDAMLWAARPDGCEISILNAGSIRVDDIITPEITEYSILRALPYGGSIRIAEMKGWFIKKLITAGILLKNDGGFVQYSDNLNINPWSIDKVPVSDSGSYKVAIANYLITGQQSKLEFIKEGTPGIISVDAAPAPRDSALYDVRKAVIKYLEKYCNDKNVIAKYR
jgi:2',3'-cyclic-nucleotide 2'-phosphodiesterase (5'-nucleotidase family)